MLKTLWQKSQSHVLAIAVFLTVTIIYCLPAFKGMVINQHDMIGAKGMVQQSVEFREKYGHYPLWTNSMFSGMPAYQMAMEPQSNITIAHLDRLFKLNLPSPANLFFLSCIGFYILCVTFGLSTWVSIFGSLAYAFSSYNAIIATVGHVTKFSAMGYGPAVIAGFILLTQRKYVLGFITTLLFTTLIVFSWHIQVVYYYLLVLLVIALVFAIRMVREKDFSHLLKTAALSLIAGAIGAISYSQILLPVNEYTKETMRGGRSELTFNKPNEKKSSTGLDKEYAFRWSYGISESLTIALPAFKGGSSGPSELGEKSKAVESLLEQSQQMALPQNYINQLYGLLSAYWGPQTSGTSGPVYFGVIVVIFFILGLFMIRNWNIAWIGGITLISFLMAWGSNLSFLNNFLFDHLPYYNKFRTPSMILVIPQFTFPLLGAMSLDKMILSKKPSSLNWKSLKPALLTILGLGILLTAFYFFNDYKGPSDKQRKDVMTNAFTQVLSQKQTSGLNALSLSNNIFDGLYEDRQAMYGKDLLRFWIFALLTIGLIYLSVNGKINALTFGISVCVVLLFDLIPIDLRYLSEKQYVPADEFELPLQPTAADLKIKQDTGYYRVFDQSSGDPFNDSRGAYHHNIINGYNPAKLGLYQDLIENQISKSNMQVLNMLNTKYILVSDQQTGEPQVYTNPEAMGPCWLVKNVRFVKNADEEMKALDSIKPFDTAYLDEKERSKLSFAPEWDSTAQIKLIKNLNDQIYYESNTSKNQLAVFSEIYYPLGWKAFINGKETPILKVNYCFRAIALPSGKHKIEFRFEPDSVKKGGQLSLWAGILSWILLLGGIGWLLRDQMKSSTKDKSPKV